MKKTFPIIVEKNAPERVIEAIKSELRKYVKRERNKKLPEGFDFWDFDCKVGHKVEEATELHVAEINAALDHALEDKWETIHFEILAKPAVRSRKPNSND